MHDAGRRLVVELKMWCDLAVCAISLLLASSLITRPFWDKDVLLVQHPFVQLILLLMLIGGWHLSLVLAGLYRSLRNATRRETALSIAQGIALATLFTAAWVWTHNMAAGNGPAITLTMTAESAMFSATALLLLVALRLMWRDLMQSLHRRGRNVRYVLIAGTNRRATRIADMLLSDPVSGHRILGFVDDGWHDPNASETYRSMLVGGLDQLPELLRTLVLDEVIIALPLASTYSRVRSIVSDCAQQGVPTRCEVSLFNPATISAPQRTFPLHLVTMDHHTRDIMAVGAKRALDIAVSLLAIGLLSPAFVVIGILIKATSPGPVFFLQERLGLGKRRFTIFKFRTMVSNAETLLATVEHLNQSQGPTFKLVEDPRITLVGSFLRKTSIDELPQLFNVLWGDMSLVGPRPLPLRDYKGFSEDWHRRRFSVKPGITCLWQVMGRSTIGFDRWMRLDMDYIDGWTLWLDIKILLRTIPVVLRGSGAV
jgi:exopolysaccharide biosynthesis polyprenyl glycosylphosphotransferase